MGKYLSLLRRPLKPMTAFIILLSIQSPLTAYELSQRMHLWNALHSEEWSPSLVVPTSYERFRIMFESDHGRLPADFLMDGKMLAFKSHGDFMSQVPDPHVIQSVQRDRFLDKVGYRLSEILQKDGNRLFHDASFLLWTYGKIFIPQNAQIGPQRLHGPLPSNSHS